MKKYYQAILAVTAVTSLVSLLIYRHEYNRLRNVLEVFDYFGKPGKRVNCSNAASSNLLLDSNDTFDARFEEPLSSWQRLDDDLYVYSVYHMHDRKIHALALGKRDSLASRRCAIYFEYETTPSLDTSFDYDVIQGTDASPYAGFRIVCSFSSDKTPIRVSFIQSLDDYIPDTDSPLFSVKTQPRRLRQEVELVVCVAPPLANFMPATQMLGFLNFHRSIGAKRFVVYDFGIPSALDGRFKEMPQFSYASIPWNVPFVEIDNDAVRGIVQAECLYRTHNKAKFIVMLSWDEYAVLMYHRSIIDLLADFDRSKMSAERFRLSSLTFCTQQPDNKLFANATLLAFRKMTYNERVGDERRAVYVHRAGALMLNGSGGYTRQIGKDLMRVHRYRLCKNLEEAGRTFGSDSSITRFLANVEDMSLPVHYSDVE